MEPATATAKEIAELLSKKVVEVATVYAENDDLHQFQTSMIGHLIGALLVTLKVIDRLENPVSE